MIGASDSGGNFEELDTSDTSVLAVNDAPINTVASSQTVAEDTNLAVTGLSISDANSGGATNVTTTLTVAHGTPTVASAGGATESGSGTNSGTLTQGSIARGFNATLAAANNAIYRGTSDFNGSDALTITTNDHGNTGIDPGLSGAANSEQDTDTATITITAVNDAPVATITPVSYAATEQVAVSLKANGLVDQRMPMPAPVP